MRNYVGREKAGHGLRITRAGSRHVRRVMGSWRGAGCGISLRVRSPSGISAALAVGASGCAALESLRWPGSS